MRRRALTMTVSVALMVGVFALPAPAAIHELVASHCAGDELPNNMANVDPPGQIRFGESSFLRALQASGLYEVIEGEDPDGNPGPFVTINLNDDRPNSKFSWDGETYFSFPFDGLTVFVPAAEPDHPAFENCAKLQP